MLILVDEVIKECVIVLNLYACQFIIFLQIDHYRLQIIAVCRVCDMADGGFSNGLVIVITCYAC